jgi:folate-binding protein YgfZ
MTTPSSNIAEAIDIAALRHIGGFFEASDYGLIEIYGPDARRFLQSQTTNDVFALPEYGFQFNSLLDRKAHIQSFFRLYRKHDSYRILIEKKQISATLEHLDKFRFADKVEFLDLTNSGKFFAVQGPMSRRLINAGFTGASKLHVFDHALSDAHLFDCAVHIFKCSLTGDDGYFMWLAGGDVQAFSDKFKAACKACELLAIDSSELNVARVEAGMLQFGVDFGAENFLPETGLEHDAASYTKGCFQGQEVLARVKSQGAPSRGLMGLMFDEGEKLSFGIDSKIMVGVDEIGWMRSNVYSKSLNRTIAFAFLKRDFRVPDKVWNVIIDGKELSMQIVSLPFYKAETAIQRAQRLYEEAINTYARHGDSSSKCIALLREALSLSPKYEDAYEALGVILSKSGEIEEAILLMKKLAELNPDSVMAHTNLSVFYVEKGLKDEAEEELAISMSIRMRVAAKQATDERKEKEEKELLRQKTLERMAMFKEVLTIDEDDLLANYGCGDCHVALGEYEEAIPLLEKTIALKPSYTVAYVALGAAFEGLLDLTRAKAIYQEGVAVASKRGDLMPMQEMQKRLALLQMKESADKTS